MHVSFDKSIKIAGISIVPWNRLGLENWLPDYKIASLFGWGGNAGKSLPELFSLEDSDVRSTIYRFNTQSLLRTAEFQTLLRAKLPGYGLLTYRPTTIPEELGEFKFLMSDSSVAKAYENKVQFREILGGLVVMPRYEIHKATEVKAAGYAEFSGRFGDFVMQDESLSGGKGTFLVRSEDDFTGALQVLKPSNSLVISELVDAIDVSIQACVTGNEIYTGPMQRQIVRHPALCNLAVAGDKFCGAVIMKSDQQTAVHDQAQDLAKIIGGHMQAAGYRGVFGLDLLLDEQGKLYALEVNPRLTGVTPLLNALYKPGHVPFYLLHVLELGSYSYEVSGLPDFDEEGSLLIVHSLDPTATKVVEMLPSGTYKVENGEPVKVGDNIRLDRLGENEFVLQDFVTEGMRTKPGGRLAALYFKRNLIDNNTNKLYNDTLQIIDAVQKRIKLIDDE